MLGRRLSPVGLEPRTFLLIQSLDDTLLVLVSLYFAARCYPRSLAGIGFRGVRGGWWVLGLLAGIGAVAGAWAVDGALRAAGWPPADHPVEGLLDRARGPGDLALLLVGVTVPVPIGEEVFFRGFLYTLLRARWGAPWAIALSSLLFALVHGVHDPTPPSWLPVLPVGLALAVLAERSRSLLPPILAHGVVNLVAILGTVGLGWRSNI
ncbi:MAG: CPBP family intramembrane metalloprotease [Candidatus Rokubacteria bacterium]|nr:CPBP family intramembrane metalloprotease [Candidatus Rokubacteria bacterium]